jgi:hypothetical protein
MMLVITGADMLGVAEAELENETGSKVNTSAHNK